MDSSEIPSNNGPLQPPRYNWALLAHRQLRVSEFTRHVGKLCARREIDIYRLAQCLTVDPTELLEMINGRLLPTNAVLSGLALELDTDGRYLEKLAEKIQPNE
jgi:hypothetical protein